MTCEEIARREEWNRIMAWLKGPPSRIVTTPRQRAVNQRRASEDSQTFGRGGNPVPGEALACIDDCFNS
jgi:hypothetical protein